MKENISPPGANAVLIAAMSKPEILEALTKAYTDAKPINDSLVDLSLRTQALTVEVYRRAIFKQLPETLIGRRRTVMRIECSVHPNHGIPQIHARLKALEEEGITISYVEYDESTGAYSFYGPPEFDLSKIPFPTL